MFNLILTNKQVLIVTESTTSKLAYFQWLFIQVKQLINNTYQELCHM